MKLLSWPVYLIAAAGVLVVGGLMYARSGLTYYAPKKAPVITAQAGDNQTPVADGSASSGDNASAPASNGMTDSGNTPGQRDNRADRRQQFANMTPEQREQRAQQRMAEMATTLGLTDAQKQQIEQIRKTTTDRDQRRAAIKAILTPEQQAKMDQMRAQRGNRGENRSGNGGAPANPAAPGNAPKSGT